MFLNNYGGFYRPNWQSPFLGQQVYGNPFTQNVFGAGLPYGQNVPAGQMPYNQNVLAGQMPYIWNTIPFTPHVGNSPFFYGMGTNLMGVQQGIPQTFGFNNGLLPNCGVGVTNPTLGGYGINNTLGQGFTPVAGTPQNPILGCY